MSPYCDQVDAAPVRAHVERLLSGGMTVTQIQNLSGVNRTAIRVLLGTFPGRKASQEVRAETASRLMRTRLDRGSAVAGLVPAAGTQRRLRALGALGYTGRDLCARLGYVEGARNVQIARVDVVIADTAQRVAELYEELADTVGPSARCREHARNRGWLPPIWWDDDTIDDPLTEPEGIRTYRDGKLLDDVTLPRAVRVDLMTLRGLAPAEIAERIGSPLRYIHRDRLETAVTA